MFGVCWWSRVETHKNREIGKDMKLQLNTRVLDRIMHSTVPMEKSQSVVLSSVLPGFASKGVTSGDLPFSSSNHTCFAKTCVLVTQAGLPTTTTANNDHNNDNKTKPQIDNPADESLLIRPPTRRRRLDDDDDDGSRLRAGRPNVPVGGMTVVAMVTTTIGDDV